jgi:serine/threonine-protein kinase
MSEERTEELFHAALELPVHERVAYLHGNCAGDDALRARVARLLSLHDDAERVLAPPPAIGALGDADAAALIGETIAGFTLRAVLGVGGMGTVFLAQQAHPSREVALKVLHAGLLTAAAS